MSWGSGRRKLKGWVENDSKGRGVVVWVVELGIGLFYDVYGLLEESVGKFVLVFDCRRWEFRLFYFRILKWLVFLLLFCFFFVKVVIVVFYK